MASGQEHGEIEVRAFNVGTGQLIPLKRQRSEVLGYVVPASRTNPQEQDERIAFMEGGTWVDENNQVQLWMKSDAADIVESEESKFFSDVTLRDKKSGREIATALSFENMTGFTAGGTVDTTLIAAEPKLVAYYTVPANQQLCLGRRDGRGKMYAYLGDDA